MGGFRRRAHREPTVLPREAAPTSSAREDVFFCLPSSSQAPDPCERTPGPGWRSHRGATSAGRPGRGACELDNESRGRRRRAAATRARRPGVGTPAAQRPDSPRPPAAGRVRALCTPASTRRCRSRAAGGRFRSVSNVPDLTPQRARGRGQEQRLHSTTQRSKSKNQKRRGEPGTPRTPQSTARFQVPPATPLLPPRDR